MMTTRSKSWLRSVTPKSFSGLGSIKRFSHLLLLPLSMSRSCHKERGRVKQLSILPHLVGCYDTRFSVMGILTQMNCFIQSMWSRPTTTMLLSSMCSTPRSIV
ncbi:hypothetical protein CSKR_114059 [Clonorchis sinensis]|uniref:Uncharacterized protein n=1 Tax=Clonorchis sinensis TaxID=79923 RepID=A0A3R7CEF8_CLOSI|nr:hypothetical protein CSKR_114059 [Clonorchis sinensis]